MKNSETTIPESMDSLITDSWKLVHLTLGSFLCHCIGTLADSWNYGVLKLPFLKSTGLLKLRIPETTIPSSTDALEFLHEQFLVTNLLLE